MVGKIDELFVPGIHEFLEGVFGERFFDFWGVVVFVVFAELDDLAEGCGLDVGQVDLLFDSGVLDHVLKELGLLGDGLVDLELALVRRNQHHSAHQIIKYDKRIT